MASCFFSPMCLRIATWSMCFCECLSHFRVDRRVGAGMQDMSLTAWTEGPFRGAFSCLGRTPLCWKPVIFWSFSLVAVVIFLVVHIYVLYRIDDILWQGFFYTVNDALSLARLIESDIMHTHTSGNSRRSLTTIDLEVQIVSGLKLTPAPMIA